MPGVRSTASNGLARAGQGWSAPALQAERDAGAPQGIGSVQGGIHSALSSTYTDAGCVLAQGDSGQTIRISGIATAITTRVSGSPSFQ